MTEIGHVTYLFHSLLLRHFGDPRIFGKNILPSSLLRPAIIFSRNKSCLFKNKITEIVFNQRLFQMVSNKANASRSRFWDESSRSVILYELEATTKHIILAQFSSDRDQTGSRTKPVRRSLMINLPKIIAVTSLKH